MIEIVMIVGLIAFAARLALLQDESPLIWGAVTFGLCIGSVRVFPQSPFTRIFIAMGALIALWTVVALIRD